MNNITEDLLFNDAFGFEKELDTITGNLSLKFYLPGEKFKFNLNGFPFSFSDFILIVESNAGRLENIILEAEEVPENFLLICNALNFEVIEQEIRTRESVKVKLSIKKYILENEIRPMIKDATDIKLEQLFSLKDSSNNQYYLTDFYYYEIIV
jgi:hypothetical protein